MRTLGLRLGGGNRLRLGSGPVGGGNGLILFLALLHSFLGRSQGRRRGVRFRLRRRGHQPRQPLAAIQVIRVRDRIQFHEFVDGDAGTRRDALHGVIVLDQVVLGCHGLCRRRRGTRGSRSRRGDDRGRCHGRGGRRRCRRRGRGAFGGRSCRPCGRSLGRYVCRWRHRSDDHGFHRTEPRGQQVGAPLCRGSGQAHDVPCGHRALARPHERDAKPDSATASVSRSTPRAFTSAALEALELSFTSTNCGSEPRCRGPEVLARILRQSSGPRGSTR